MRKEVQRALYNAVVDLRFGAPLTGEVKTRFAEHGASDTVNSDYVILERIFAGADIRSDDVLVDVGCGKGRVINHWLRQGLRNPMIGTELDATIAERTRRRLRKHAGVTILTGDAVDLIPEHGTFFYLFNPFGAEVMARFAERLADLGRRRGDEIRVLYNNCKHLAAFGEGAGWRVDTLDPATTGQRNPVAHITFAG